MNLDQWRQNDELVAWAHNLMLRPEWTALMSVMGEEHPMHKMTHKPGFPEHDNSKAIGVIMGWNQFEMTLKLSGIPHQPQSGHVPSTFPTPEAEVEVEPQAEKPSVKRRSKK